jgi:hypothetical protein
MKWSLLLVLLFSSQLFAFDNPYFMRSPRALLMGDAFTAVNDDDFTLFYNPASLARHKNDFTFYPFNGQLSGTNILSDMQRFKNFPQNPSGVSNVLMDYPAHASAGVAPGFKLFNVGVNFLANDSYDVLLRDKTHPMLDLDMRSDRGVVVGIGLPIGPHRINRKTKSGSQTALGFSTKYIERTGVVDTLALTGTTVLNTLNQNQLQDVLNNLGRVKGVGWGFDAGIEHVVKDGHSQFVTGLTALDINGTNFKMAQNPNNLKVANNRTQVNWGLAGGHDFKFFHYILSADVRALNEQMDFGKRLRFGAEVGIPGLSLMAGINSGYYSYGATIDLAFMKFTAGFYDVELGSQYQQVKSKRFVVYLSLFDFSFDA